MREKRKTGGRESEHIESEREKEKSVSEPDRFFRVSFPCDKSRQF